VYISFWLRLSGVVMFASVGLAIATRRGPFWAGLGGPGHATLALLAMLATVPLWNAAASAIAGRRRQALHRAIAAGELARARRLLDDLIALHRRSHRADWLRLDEGWLLEREGRFDEALAAFGRARPDRLAAGTRPWLDLHRALCLLERGRGAEAIEVAQQARRGAEQWAPHLLPDCTSLLGLAFLEAEQPRLAIPILRTALTLGAADRAGQSMRACQLGDALARVGDPDAACLAWLRAQEEEPGGPWAAQARARLEHLEQPYR
jgi:tetratricopeptide (TPR) repeat protein